MREEARSVWRHVVTHAWSYIMIGAGSALNLVDVASAVVGDPDLNKQIADMLHANPHWLGVYLIVAGKITMIARIRAIAKAAKAAEGA